MAAMPASMELPTDGEYSLELHDELFGPRATVSSRLQIGELQYADLRGPMGVAIGGAAAIKRISTNIRTMRS